MIRGDRRFIWMESRHELHLPRHGSTIVLAGLDDEDRVDKILGSEYLNIFLNEATQISWPTVQMALTRLSQPLPGNPIHRLILDCNPKNQRHWLHRAGVQHLDPDSDKPLPDVATWARLHWTPYDNPYLPADYMHTLESLTGVKRRRMLEGVWCDNEGAVYDEFDEDTHTFDDLPPGSDAWTRVRAIDFGYTNPFVSLTAAIDPDGRLWIYHERYVDHVIVSEHAKAMNEHPDANRIAWTVADHDAEDRATLAACGINTIAANKAVIVGIDAVKARLAVQGDGRPRLMVSTRCPMTISEFYDYAWEFPKDGSNAKEAPRKDRDHAQDPIRYLVMQLDAGCILKAASAAITPPEATATAPVSDWSKW
jgi:phage terminase large subunit